MSARGADRKAAILDAAVARIVAHGFEGLRVRDVARDVGINNATLHHHFATKAALVAAILQRFVAVFEVAGVPDGGPLEARLAAYVDARRVQMREAPDTFVVLNELLVLAARDAEVRREMVGLQTGWGDYLAAVCRAAGLDAEAAAARADRCRRELIGLSLEIGLGRG